MRSRVKAVMAVAVVVVAVSAMGASAAMATAPGPYFKNGAGTLGEGQSVALKVKQVTAYTNLYGLGDETGPLVECTAASGEGKAYDEYVKGVLKEGRLKEAKVILEGCGTAAGSSGCKINGAEAGEASIAFEHILGRLGYKPGTTEKEREEGKGVEGLVYPEAGKAFVTIQFTGLDCGLPRTKFPLTGGVIWTGSPVNKLATSLIMAARVNSNAEQELREINFPAFSETLTGQHLAGGSNSFSLSGELELTPPAGVELGVFT